MSVLLGQPAVLGTPTLMLPPYIFDSTGEKPVATIAQGQDITELKKADQIKDEFIGLVSHEMRTPLTVITGAVQTAMDERIAPEDKRDMLAEARQAAENLGDILENLLELSRHQADRLRLEKKKVSLTELAQQTAGEFRRLATHTVVLDMPDGPDVLVDPVRFQRVLHNLLENAVKYSPPGTEVRVFERLEERDVVIGVSDHGPGISAKDQSRLFEPF